MEVKGAGRNRDRTELGLKYTIFGSRMSFFTQKVLAGFSWHLPASEFEFQPKALSNPQELEKRAGTHQIPVVQTPENWIIADSTPIFKLVDSRLPSPKFYLGSSFTRCIIAILEEYFDEWSARLTIHTRWKYDETADDAALKMARESSDGKLDSASERQLADGIKGWGRRAIRALGMSSAVQQRAGEDELYRVMRGLSEHLSEHRFVLGPSPCALDAVLMGGLRAHFLEDIWPSRHLSSLTPLKRWLEEDFGAEIPRDVQAASLDPANLPPFVQLVLGEMGGGYKNMVLENASALRRGEKAFVARVYGEDVSYLKRPYVEKSRMMLRSTMASWLEGDPKSRADVERVLAEYGLLEAYSPTTISKM